MSGPAERMLRRAGGAVVALLASLLVGDPAANGSAPEGFDLPPERLPLWRLPAGVPADTGDWTSIDAARPPAAFGCPGVGPDDGSDDARALQCLIRAAPERSVIQLPEGGLRLERGISIGRSSLVLRGAGMGRTRIEVAAQAKPGNYTRACDRPGWIKLCEPTGAYGPWVEWLEGYSQGAREIRVADARSIEIGDWVALEQDLPARDAHDVRFRGREGFRWMSRVVAKRDRTLGIEPPLLEDFDVGGQRVRRVPVIEHVGLEDLSVYRVDPDLGGACAVGRCALEYDYFVRLWRVARGWLERVELRDNYSHLLQLRHDVAGLVVRHGLFRRLHKRDRVAHQTAIMAEGAYGCVFEGNRVEDVARWLTLEAGARGNVVAYNYESPVTEVALPEGRAVFLHGHYAGANLIEGNHFSRHVSQDNYWGRQGRHNTFFRNRALNDAWRVCVDARGERSDRACRDDADCRAGEGCHDDLRSGFEAHADAGCPAGADPGGETEDTNGDCTAISFGANYLANSGSALYPNPAGRRSPATTPLDLSWRQAKNSRGLLWDFWLEKNLMRTAIRVDASAAARGGRCGGAQASDDDCAARGGFVGDNYVGARAPRRWGGFEGPDSLYRESAPGWWCREACPFALEEGIGAFGDDLDPTHAAALCPLPAQLVHEGRTCSRLGPSDRPGGSGGVSGRDATPDSGRVAGR